MNARYNRAGFSIVELVIIAAVVALVGFLGYTAYKNMNKTTSTSSSQSATATDVKATPVVNTTADLNTAATTLDQTDPSGSNTTDTSQLDAELANF